MGGIMGGGSVAQAPTVDPAINQQLIGIYNQNIGGVTKKTGDANRAEVGRNALAGLNLLTNQGEVMNAEELARLRKQVARIKRLQDALASGRGKPEDRAAWSKELKAHLAKSSLEDRETRIATLSSPDFAANRLRSSLKEQYGMRDDLIGSMLGALGSTREYNRMQDAFARGLTAQQADMERMQAQQTDESTLGRSLMDEAQRKMAQGGQLSPEAQREAIQSARQGMAARGMATGNAALAAELLNRDRFSRQREFENLGFAQNVEANDLARRSANTQFRQQAGMQNAQAFNQLSQFNTLQRDGINRFNVGLLEQSAVRADQERLRQLGLQQDAYNFAMGTDPRMVAAGLGQPYANLTGSTSAAANVVGGIASTPQYSGGQFSSGGAGGALMGAGTGALGGALAMAPTGNPYLIGGGALVGGITGAMGGSR